MSEVIGLRPFIPAKEYERSIAFYQALGFAVTYQDSRVTVMDLDGSMFILQNFYVEAHAANCMVQLLVTDAAAWWAAHAPEATAAQFGAKPPIPPTLQHWGLVVGFIFDPSGVLWHVAEPPA